MKTKHTTCTKTSSVTNPVALSKRPFSPSSTNSGFLMKLLPHRRRQSEDVKRTSFVLDDYANLLSRDSHFLASVADAATVSSATASISESTHRPSIVSIASVGSFQRQEVSLGGLLGKGQFSKVYEVAAIELNLSSDEEDANMTEFDAVGENARIAMSKNARAGKYAMKRLRKKLLRRPRDFTRAAANLVVEARYLSKLDHPHILKLRGSALGEASSYRKGEHDGFFLILDRVTETLQERIHHNWMGRRVQAPAVEPLNEPELLHQKTHYALQLTSAIHYLHDRRIIFRDLKPANLGFTDEHSLQLFDFGLARELPQALGLANELFLMTQNAGSKPYTAVEVTTTGLYNLKADVYSFAMVAFHIFMERMPFAHMADSSSSSKKPSNREYVQAVFIDGERPSFDTTEDDAKIAAPTVPRNIQDLLTKCWQADLFCRPSMEDVFFELQAILEELPHAQNLGAVPSPNANMVLQTQQRPSFADLSDLSNIVQYRSTADC